MFTHQPPFGLDISNLSLKLISLKKKGKQIHLASHNQIKVPKGCFIDGEIKEKEKIIKLIKELIKKAQGEKIKTPYIISTIPEAKTFIKLIEVSTKDGKVDPKIIKEELKLHIPLSIEETYFDWQKITPREDKMKILVTVIPKKFVDDYFSLLKEAGLKPLVFEPESAAICRALIKERSSEEGLIVKERSSEEGLIVFDIGATRSSIIIFDQGTIQFTMTLPVSGEKITKTIAEKLKISLEEAEKVKVTCRFDEKKCKEKLKEALYPVMENLVKKIQEAQSFYKEDHLPPNHRKITRVLLCGGGANFKEIEKVLSEKLNLKVEKADPLWQITISKNLYTSQSEALTYTTAIGLALRGILAF